MKDIFRIIIPRVALGFALVALNSGCATQGDVSGQSLKANLAVEEAHNQLLLVNVLRAYKQRPMYFTGIRTLRGPLGAASPTFSFRIPFGPDFTNNIYEFSPTIKPDIAQYDVAVMDTQEFIRGITQPLPPKVLQYYLDQGWPRELLLHIFIREVRIFKGEEMIERLLNYPRDEKTFKDFQEWIHGISSCALEFDNVIEDVGPVLMDSEVRDIAKLAAVKKEGLALQRIDEKGQITHDDKTTKGYRVRKPTEGLTFKVKKKEPRCENVPKNVEALLVSRDQAAPSGLGEGRRAVLLLRSPEAMLYYLGEIVRRQLKGTLNNPDDRSLVEVTLSHPSDPKRDRPFSIFVVRAVPNGQSIHAAVTVTYDGETFVIPGVEVEAGRSMQVLSLISQLIGLQNKASDLPQTTTVRVIQ